MSCHPVAEVEFQLKGQGIARSESGTVPDDPTDVSAGRRGCSPLEGVCICTISGMNIDGRYRGGFAPAPSLRTADLGSVKLAVSHVT